MSHPSSQKSDDAPALPLRIFLVEDSSLVRELVIETFAEIDGVVLGGFADSEEAAFCQLVAAPYDILILDIELKQGNGINLLRRLSALPDPPARVKIVFSNNVSAAYRRVAEPLGVQFFFDKTTEFNLLREVLESLGHGTEPGDIAR